MSLIERYDGELADLRAYAEVSADQLRRHNRELSERGAEVESLRQQLAGAVDLLHELADGVAENQASPNVRYSHRVREALEAIDAAGYRPSTRGQ